jgi:hypothetical protein
MNRSHNKGYLEFFGVGITIMVTMVLLGVAGNAGRQHSDPSVRESVPAGDCAACHGEKKVLPGGHEETRAMKMAECADCHAGAEQNLRSRIPLGHIHGLHGTGCGGCHKDPAKPGQLSTGDCLVCHKSFEVVAGRTATRRPDPHNSPHYGNSVDCDVCHRIHKPSENFCAQCHDWKLTVP